MTCDDPVMMSSTD